MRVAVPSEQHICAQLDALLKKDPDARAMALRSPRQGRWPDQIERQGRSYRLAWVESELAIRQALRSVGDGEGLVLVTNLQDADLGDDILARLAKGKVFEIESWRMLQDAFQARHVDPRLRGQGWIADVLLEHQPVGGYPPVPGGVLDADTAWRCVLQRSVGLEENRPDILSLLTWATSEGSLYRLAKLSTEAGDTITQHLASTTGPAGALFMRAVSAGYGSLAVPLGLVCDAIFAAADDQTGETAQVITRLERYFSGHRPEPGAAAAWADASVTLVRLELGKAGGRDVVQSWFREALRILKEIHADSHVARSRILPEAFEARLESLAKSLTSSMEAGITSASLPSAETAATHALTHEQARLQPERADRVHMAIRLMRWLSGPDGEGTGFHDIAREYVTDSGFADRARLSLKGGDESALLSAAYVQLLEIARKRRETENGRFAAALGAWNKAPHASQDILPIEGVLDAVVAPLAARNPVLLLVMDGLSFPVFRELTDALVKDGWQSLRREGETPFRAAVAALPTRTEVSRASLLCGELTVGAANVERAGFARHPALVKASRSGRPPIVFHKGDLTDGSTSLSNEVRQALADGQQRVVGIVYNAVDDHLSGSDQLRLGWGLDGLRLLRPILHEARSAGRVVVVTADHGHVIEDGSTKLPGEDTADRSRSSGQPPQAGEIELQGGRVKAAPQNSIVMAWSEGLRYASKKNGYHGGASPQEVLVPLSVFASDALPKDWTFDAPAEPDWWIAPLDISHTAPVETTPLLAKPSPRRRTPKAAQGQASLFADEPQTPAPPPTAQPGRGWIDDLMASETYQAQAQMAGSARPQDDLLRIFVEALAERGRMAAPALAKRVKLAAFQMQGFIYQVSRVLNVDQSPVVVYDPSSQMVELDVKLLREQFEIGG